MYTIYVGNISFQSDEDALENLFSQYGEIQEVNIIRDRKTNRSKGYGFVTFATQESADAALAQNEKEFEGRTLRVNPARPKQDS